MSRISFEGSLRERGCAHAQWRYSDGMVPVTVCRSRTRGWWARGRVARVDLSSVAWMLPAFRVLRHRVYAPSVPCERWLELGGVVSQHRRECSVSRSTGPGIGTQLGRLLYRSKYRKTHNIPHRYQSTINACAVKGKNIEIAARGADPRTPPAASGQSPGVEPSRPHRA